MTVTVVMVVKLMSITFYLTVSLFSLVFQPSVSVYIRANTLKINRVHVVMKVIQSQNHSSVTHISAIYR